MLTLTDHIVSTIRTVTTHPIVSRRGGVSVDAGGGSARFAVAPEPPAADADGSSVIGSALRFGAFQVAR